MVYCLVIHQMLNYTVYFLDDTLVSKISGLSTTTKIYGGNVDLPQDLVLQNSWIENSGTSTPKILQRVKRLLCHWGYERWNTNKHNSYSQFTSWV